MQDVIVVGSNNRSNQIYEYLKNKLHKQKIQILSPSEYSKIDELIEIISEFKVCVLAGLSVRLPVEHLNKVNHTEVLTCHAGKLPEYRGSSPLNWCLIRGETSFDISVIRATEKFDEGPIYASRRFDIRDDYKINDLRSIAEKNFPQLVLVALQMIALDISPTPQVGTNISYYPRRSAEDSEVQFGFLKAKDINNLIRASQPPHPLAHFYHNGEKYEIDYTESIDTTFHGIPGKVYRVKKNNLCLGIATTEGLINLSLKQPIDVQIYDRIKC